MQKKASRSVAIYKIFSTFVAHNGGLAQLARALAWHARGHEFDSRILHKKQAANSAAFFCGEHLYIPPKSPFEKGGLGREHGSR